MIRLKHLGLFFTLILFGLFGSYSLYSYVFHSSAGIVLVGTFQGIMAVSGITAGMEKELKGKARILIGLIGNGLFLFLILMTEPYRLYLEVTETASIQTYITYFIVGTLIILVGFFYGHFAKEENIVIRMFNHFSKKSQ